MKIDLGRDRVSKIFVTYSIPSVLSMLSIISAWIVDGIFVGRYVGAEGLTAINMTFPIIAFITSIGKLFGTGGITLAGVNRGLHDDKKANRIFSATFINLSILSVIMALFITMSAKKISTALGADENVIDHLSTYIRFLFMFAPAFMMNFTLDMFVRNDGFPNTPIKFAILSTVMNITLDYLLVGKLGLGLQGAGLATGLSMMTQLVLLVIYLIKKTSWKLTMPIISLKDMRDIVYNGSSEMANELAGGVTALAFNFIIMKRLGYMGVAAFSIAQYSSTLAFALFFGNAQAIHGGISHAIGAKNLKRVKAFKKIALQANIISGLAVFLVLQLFGTTLIDLFAKGDVELMKTSQEILRFYSLAFLVMGVNITLSMYFTASNLPKESMLVALTRSFFGIMIGLTVLPLIFGNIGVWLTVFFAEMLTLAVTVKLSRKSEPKLKERIIAEL